MKQLSLWWIAALVPVQSLLADVLEFNNGDRLEGKVVSMGNGEMVFRSSMVGEIKVPMASLKQFSTDQAEELHFTDGTVLQQQVVTDGRGSSVARGEVIAAQSIALDQLAAINPPPPPPVEWTGRVGAGITVETGNTETQDASVSVDAKRETPEDRIILDAEYIENKETNIDTGIETTSKRRYALGGHYDYFVAPDWYVYGDMGAEKEVTANLDSRTTVGSGIGKRFIRTDRTEFDFELGLSWVSENFSDTTEDEDYAALRVAWRFDQKLGEITRFFHKGEWYPSVEDSDNQLVQTQTGIRTRVLNILSAEAKVIFDWDNTPAMDKREDDTTYILGLGWDF